MTKATEQSSVVHFTRDQMLEASDIATEFVPIPEWAPKGDPNPSRFGVTARALTGRQRAAWQRDGMVTKGKVQEVNYNAVTVNLVVMGTIGPDGQQIFTKDDASRLLDRSAKALQRIADVVMRLSGISEDEMDTLVKNSEEMNDGGST